MATRYPLVAFAVIFSGFLISLSYTGDQNTNLISLMVFISILSGLFLLDYDYSKYALVFTSPLLIWVFVSIEALIQTRYIFPISVYLLLWLLIYIYIYRKIYKKTPIMKSHQWFGVATLAMSALIILGNREVGPINDFILWSGIDHTIWGMVFGLPGFVLVSKHNIRLTRTVLILTLPLIVYLFYTSFYLFFITQFWEIIPFLLMNIYYIGRLSEGEYYAF